MKTLYPLRLKMQYFADDAEQTTEQETTPTEQPEAKEPKTFTQDDVNRIVQERLSKAEKAHKEKLDETVATAISEGKRLAELSAEERAAEEAKRREADVAKREQELAMRELQLDTQARLTDEGLSQEFAPFLIGADSETTNDNIKAFKAVYDNAISAGVEARLKDSIVTPKAGGAMRAAGTDKPFDIKSYQNQNRLIK